MDAIKSYLDKFGSNFLVASSVPSLAFVMALMIVFAPYFEKLLNRLKEASGTISDKGIVFGILIFVLTVIIGFTLSALNTYIIKLFEGYVFFHHFSFLTRRQKRKAQKLCFERDRLSRRIKRLEERNDSRRKEGILPSLKDEYYTVAAKYDSSFPSVNGILPTKFGNILKASESYSSTRYGIDAVSLWPRLFYVIPNEYKKAINESRNELSFLVNCSLLSGIFFLLSLLGVVLCEVFAANILVKSNILVVSAFVSFPLALFFRRASLFSVGAFGDMIRSAYDLFRLDLLKQLKLKRSESSWDEYFQWKKVGEFIVLGSNSLTFDYLEYHYEEEDSK